MGYVRTAIELTVKKIKKKYEGTSLTDGCKIYTYYLLASIASMHMLPDLFFKNRNHDKKNKRRKNKNTKKIQKKIQFILI